MFALPEAKRVRREDLGRSDDSEWSDDGEMDAELQARLNAQIAKSLGLDRDEDRYVKTAPGRAAESPSREQDQSMEPEPAAGSGDEGGYAFRLFSTAGPAAKVVLEDPEADGGPGAFVKDRPLSYYLAGKPSADLQSQYDFAAVTGDEVVARSRTRSWGLELPWKVTTIKMVRKAKREQFILQGDDEMDASATKRRKRPGKKQRIAMRTKERVKAKSQEAAKQKELDKEEHLKEKKKRMNRLKKLRKRAKKKGEKGVDGAEEDDDTGSGDD